MNTKRIMILGFAALLSWSIAAQGQPSCGTSTPLTVALVANGSIPAGTVTVSNDASHVFVTVTTSGDFTIARLDVATASTLAGIPQSGGQPDLSQFPNQQTFSPEVTTYTFTIPTTVVNGAMLIVAVHASLDSPTQGHQQAWDAGQLFPCSPVCTASGCSDDDDHGGGDSIVVGHDNHCDEGHRMAYRHQSSSPQWGDMCHGQGDGQKVAPEWGDHGGGSQCSGSHHGNRSVHQDGGGDGGDEGGGSSDCQAGCGASYFVYTENCFQIEAAPH